MAWLFTAQDARAIGMGQEVCSTFSQARRIMQQAEEISGLPLSRLCWEEGEVLDRTEVQQPAITAITLGCLALLEEAGGAPDCVAGHGLGEFSALCAAGALSVEDTLYLVTCRGRLMQEAAQRHPGGMLSVRGLPTEGVQELVDSLAGRYRQYVAYYNAQSQTVVSGELDALQVVAARVSRCGGQAEMLREGGPWHSPLMNEARERFFDALCRVDFHAPRIPIYLNTTGQTESDPHRIAAEVLTQMTQPVRWMQMMEGMTAMSTRIFMEVGPGSVLQGKLRISLEGAQACSA
jgi:[acyl-carrier-protein] S-malonyltransferase